MHVSSLSYLILHLRFAFSHPIFVQNQSLIPYLFQSTQQWTLLNMFQASKTAVGLHQHYSKNDFNQYGFLMKETVPKIPTQLQTKLFINLL